MSIVKVVRRLADRCIWQMHSWHMCSDLSETPRRFATRECRRCKRQQTYTHEHGWQTYVPQQKELK